MVKGSITPAVTVNRNITVSVSDGSTGIENVTVVLEGTDGTQYSGKTGSAGGCRISNVPEGTYTVQASATGYEPYTGNITVNEENTTLNITLTEE